MLSCFQQTLSKLHKQKLMFCKVGQRHILSIPFTAKQKPNVIMPTYFRYCTVCICLFQVAGTATTLLHCNDSMLSKSTKKNETERRNYLLCYKPCGLCFYITQRLFTLIASSFLPKQTDIDGSIFLRTSL